MTCHLHRICFVHGLCFIYPHYMVFGTHNGMNRAFHSHRLLPKAARFNKQSENMNMKIFTFKCLSKEIYFFSFSLLRCFTINPQSHQNIHGIQRLWMIYVDHWEVAMQLCNPKIIAYSLSPNIRFVFSDCRFFSQNLFMLLRANVQQQKQYKSH